MRDERSGDGGCLFLCGADMDPTAVRSSYPGARFVARARVAADDRDASDPATVWGILIRVPAGARADEGDPVGSVVTDDGRRFEAGLVGGGRPAGEPGAILAQAQYWELPPAYVKRLRDAAASGSDDDG